MENNNTILQELREISLLLASIGQQPTYTVPDGYFENLPMQVLLRIGLEEKAGKDPVINISKNNVYQAPEGYFDTLANNILNRIKTGTKDEQLEEPDFSSSLWQQVGKKHPFTVPEGYFNEVSGNIVAGAKAIAFVNEELENLSPLMNSLKNKPVYEVPQGYFDNTVAAILQKAKQQRGKLVSIGFTRKIIRYAAAAIVAGLIVLAGYMYSGTTTHTVSSANPDLAKVTDQEIENFLNNNTASVADTSNIVVADDEITDKDSKDLLANISDDELQQYAAQHLETPITN